MKQISLVGIEPFSINNAYNMNKTRSRAYREWADRVWDRLTLKHNEETVNAFKGSDEPLAILIVYTMPNLHTKKGTISRLSKDLTNVEKTLVDVLCEGRYQGRELRNGKIINNMDLDDKNICYLQSFKKFGPKFRIDVFIERIGELNENK